MQLGILEAIESAFIEAAIDPALWEKAMDGAASATGSHGAVLLPVTGTMISTVPFSEAVRGSFETYIRDGWCFRDERFRGVDIMKRSGIVDDLDLFTKEEIDRHPYYQEFLAPHRLRWFGGIKVACGSDLWCLSIQRTIEQAPFSEAEKSQLANLSRRLSSAAAIANSIGGSTAGGILHAFEISGRGAALINRQGEIFRLNGAAERMLQQDVRVVRRRLVAHDQEANAAFERSVGQLLNSPSAALRAPIAFARKGRHPLLAYPAKLSNMAGNALADCQVVVIFVDTEIGSIPPTGALQAVFHLSGAEARLAAELAAGESLEVVADRIGITKETARSQLKSVFSKTGCNRQAALVAILSTFLNAGQKT